MDFAVQSSSPLAATLGLWPPDHSSAALSTSLSCLLDGAFPPPRSSGLASNSMFGTKLKIPLQVLYLELCPFQEKKRCPPGCCCHTRMFYSCSGFPDCPTITCSFSSSREGPTTEQGLPASAAGCQAVPAAVPSW